MREDLSSSHLLEVLRSLSHGKVLYVVGGGVALVLYGHERMTLDLDIALDLRPANLNRFGKCMDALALKPATREPMDSLGKPERLQFLAEKKNAFVFPFQDPDLPYRQLDVFLPQYGSYEKLRVDATMVEMPGFHIWVASLQCLLDMKRGIKTPSPKDQWDIHFLESALAGDESE